VKTVSRELLAAHRARQGRTSFYGAPAPQHRSTRLGANVLECFALRFWAARSLERQCRGPQRSRRAMTASERGAGSSGRSSASPSGRHALETMISIAFGLLPPLPRPSPLSIPLALMLPVSCGESLDRLASVRQLHALPKSVCEARRLPGVHHRFDTQAGGHFFHEQRLAILSMRRCLGDADANRGRSEFFNSCSRMQAEAKAEA